MHIGLWGCGGMGGSLAKALQATGEARLAAVYDVRPEAASKLAETYGAEAVASAETLLGYPGLDGVIIATPSDVHAPAVIQAAEAGLDVFVEKPMSLDTARCQEMLAAARRSGIKLMVGHVLRYYEPYRSIQRWQAEGRFGPLFAASMWRVTNGRRIAKTSWRASRARSGGYLFEVGIHELDMLRCMMGQPQSVYATLRNAVPKAGEWADYVALQLRFAFGSAAAYEAGVGSCVGRYGFRFYFECATLVSDAAFDRTALQIYGPDGQSIEIPEAFSPEHPVEAELRGWLSALRDEGPVPIPGEEGLASVALVEAAYCSAETGQVVAYE
jgi:predicted dehydrogenase